MIRIIKHIPFLLFGFYFLIIQFKSIHVVWDSLHNNDCIHDVLYHSEDSNENETVTPKHDECSICEFQLFINYLPKAFSISLINPKIVSVQNILSDYFTTNLLITVKNPRAPPIYYS